MMASNLMISSQGNSKLLLFLLILFQPVFPQALQICPDECECFSKLSVLTMECKDAELSSVPCGFDSSLKVESIYDISYITNIR